MTSSTQNKRFNGKALYQPSGKAAEYSPWAVNFFTGCSNDCEYCYCKRGVLNHVWSTEPHLKKCFKDEADALEVFKRELQHALVGHPSIKERGILFSFTTDPMLPETCDLTLRSTAFAVENGVPVKILTKRADWYNALCSTEEERDNFFKGKRGLIAFGFTLTGFDDIEPGASLTCDRIGLMHKLHYLGFKTFASIEPVISPQRAKVMIESISGFCDLFKVGLISGKNKLFYNRELLGCFLSWLQFEAKRSKIYLKNSVLDYFKLSRAELSDKFVGEDYNIFHADE